MDYERIGRRIREVRGRRRMTQAELAESAGYSVAFINYVENAKKHPGLKAIVRIANALNTTADDLLVGNQGDARGQSTAEVDAIFDDCTVYEWRVMIKLLSFIKLVLRESEHFLVQSGE